MEHSEPFKAVAEAFATAQLKIIGAKKDADNPYYDSRYADLASVDAACRPALNEQGIGILQDTVSEAGKVTVKTFLIHKSGEWICGSVTVPYAGNDPQKYGSALTYGRRYGLAAITGVCPEDDDANAASDKGAKQPPQHQQAPQRPAPAKMPGESEATENIKQFSESLSARDFDDVAIQKVLKSAERTQKKPLAKFTIDEWTRLFAAIDGGSFDKMKTKTADAAKAA